MTVKIERHIRTVDYAHYPGQVLIDHPDEVGMVEQGFAVPVIEEPELAVAPPLESADAPPAEEAVSPSPETRGGKRNNRNRF